MSMIHTHPIAGPEVFDDDQQHTVRRVDQDVPVTMADLLGGDLDELRYGNVMGGYARSVDRPRFTRSHRLTRNPGAIGIFVLALASAVAATTGSLLEGVGVPDRVTALIAVAALLGTATTGIVAAFHRHTRLVGTRFNRLYMQAHEDAHRAVRFLRQLPGTAGQVAQVQSRLEQLLDGCEAATRTENQLLTMLGLDDEPCLWSERSTMHTGIDKKLRGEAALAAHRLRVEVDRDYVALTEVRYAIADVADAAEDAARSRARYAEVAGLRDSHVDRIPLGVLHESTRLLRSDAVECARLADADPTTRPA